MPTEIQRAAQVNGAVTLPGVTAGNTIVVLAAWYGTTETLASLAGNGNDYDHAVGALSQDGDKNTDEFHVLAANSGDTTIAPTWAGGTPIGFALHAFELTPAELNAVGIGDGTSDQFTTAPLTTTKANAMLLSIVNQSGSSSATVPTGWDTVQHTTSAYYEDSSRLADAGAAGAKDAIWDIESLGDWVETHVAWTDPGGAEEEATFDEAANAGASFGAVPNFIGALNAGASAGHALSALGQALAAYLETVDIAEASNGLEVEEGQLLAGMAAGATFSGLAGAGALFDEAFEIIIGEQQGQGGEIGGGMSADDTFSVLAQAVGSMLGPISAGASFSGVVARVGQLLATAAISMQLSAQSDTAAGISEGVEAGANFSFPNVRTIQITAIRIAARLTGTVSIN